MATDWEQALKDYQAENLNEVCAEILKAGISLSQAAAEIGVEAPAIRKWRKKLATPSITNGLKFLALRDMVRKLGPEGVKEFMLEVGMAT